VLLALETLENRLVPSGVPTLSTGSLPADTVNVAYNQSIIASGGTGNVTLAVSNQQRHSRPEHHWQRHGQHRHQRNAHGRGQRNLHRYGNR
jgi:hypothetical protein